METTFFAIPYKDGDDARPPCWERSSQAARQVPVGDQPIFCSLQAFILDERESEKNDVCKRLQAEGVFAANRKLQAPLDFNAILVVAQECDADVDQFRHVANRLEEFDICRFTYVYSQFHGEGASQQVVDALQLALSDGSSTTADYPDAVVILCGDESKNGGSCFNDYEFARYICDLPTPVLTGIGHAPAGTVLEAVANLRFDTPSSVIAGIQQVIAKRVAEARTNFSQVTHTATRFVQSAKTRAELLNMTVRSESHRLLTQGKQSSAELFTHIHLDATRHVRCATAQSREALQRVQVKVTAQNSLENPGDVSLASALHALNNVENEI